MTDPLTRATTTRTEARDRLKDHATELRQRVSPAALKQTLIDTAKNRAQTAITDVRKKPIQTIGAVAATALILFRKPLLGAIVKRLTKEK